MEVIRDAHFHIWDASNIDYSWIDRAITEGTHFAAKGRLPGRFLPDDYALKWGPLGFVAGIHIEAGADPRFQIEETRWLAEALGGLQPRVGIVVAANLRSPDLGLYLDQSRRLSSDIVGVREIVTFSTDTSATFVAADPLLDEGWVNGLTEVQTRGLGFDLQIYPSQSRTAAEIVARHESLRFVLNHTLLPDFNDLKPWTTALHEMAGRPNVAIKIGGFGMRNPNWDVPTARRVLELCVAEFGPARCMIGTNSPVEFASSSANRFAAVVREFLAALEPNSRRLIAQENVSAWYPRPLRPNVGPA